MPPPRPPLSLSLSLFLSHSCGHVAMAPYTSGRWGCGRTARRLVVERSSHNAALSVWQVLLKAGAEVHCTNAEVLFSLSLSLSLSPLVPVLSLSRSLSLSLCGSRSVSLSLPLSAILHAARPLRPCCCRTRRRGGFVALTPSH